MPSLAIVLTDEYADWEFAPIAAIAKEFYGYDTQIVSLQAKPVSSIAGLLAIPQHKLENLEAAEFDALVIIGGKIWEGDDYPDMTPLIEEFLAKGKIIAGICGATLALARAGLLNNRNHTSNETGYIDGHVKSYTGQKLYVKTNKAVIDNKVISASGFSPHHFAAGVFRAVGMAEDQVTDYLQSLGAEFT